MLIVVVLLAVVTIMVVAIGWAVLCLERHTPDFLAGKPSIEFSERHPPLGRAFSRADLDFLFRHDGSPQMLRQFRRTRRRIMLLFLRDMRRDFHRAWSVCRRLAPLNENPDFIFALFRQLVEFEHLCLRVKFQCIVGGYGVDLNLEALVAVLGRMREAADQLVRAAELPLPQAAQL